jgi:hypothetical protein
VSSENAISVVFHFNLIGETMKRDKSNLICQFLIFPVICSMAFAASADETSTAKAHANLGFQSPLTAGDHSVWDRNFNYFEARGLVPPGSYSHKENLRPATIATNKAGQGVGKQK